MNASAASLNAGTGGGGPNGRSNFSATLDTDFRRRWVVTPLAEAASPAILFIPSLGAGIGLPIQLGREPRAGVRLQLDLHLYPLGFVTSVDLFPDDTQVTLLFQVGI